MHDTGIVAMAGPFRRLPGLLRQHQGRGEPWPDRVVLELTEPELVVSDASGVALGRWPRADVALRRTSAGPPVTFVVQLPGASHLLAAAAGAATESLLAALTAPQPGE